MTAPDEANTKELVTYVYSRRLDETPDRVIAARVEFSPHHVIFYGLDDELVLAVHERFVSYVYIEED